MSGQLITNVSSGSAELKNNGIYMQELPSVDIVIG